MFFFWFTLRSTQCLFLIVVLQVAASAFFFWVAAAKAVQRGNLRGEGLRCQRCGRAGCGLGLTIYSQCGFCAALQDRCCFEGCGFQEYILLELAHLWPWAVYRALRRHRSLAAGTPRCGIAAQRSAACSAVFAFDQMLPLCVVWGKEQKEGCSL